MNYPVPVVYENRVLWSLEPLGLPEHTRLTVTVTVRKAKRAPFGIGRGPRLLFCAIHW